MRVFHGSPNSAIGIAFEGVANVDNLAGGNRITDAPAGMEFEGGGKYQGNLTSGVATPYTGGTNVGGNN